MKVVAKALRFGPNEVDLRSYQLYRSRRPLAISRIPLNLLILLLERRGTLVTREEIAAHLWSNPEMVDTERGINNAINRIRGLLNDDPHRPRYIETAVGTGYRFIGKVEEIFESETVSSPELSAPSQPEQPVPPVNTEPANLTQARRSRWLLLTALCLVLAVTLWLLRRNLFPATQLSGAQITANESENQVTAAAISPSGQTVAYADPDGLFLQVRKSGEVLPLKLPPALRVDRIAWFSDDFHLLVSGFNRTELRFQIWTTSVAAGDPRLIRENARNATPSPDGGTLAYTGTDESTIWMSGPNGERTRIFLRGRTGEQFPFLFWAENGQRLSYEARRYSPAASGDKNRIFDLNYSWFYGSREAASGRELTSVPGIRFESACVTSDGRLIYLHTLPPRDGKQRGIWEVKTEPATGAFRSEPKQLVSLDDEGVFGLTASRDGKQIAAIWRHSQPDVYTADLQPSKPSQSAPLLANIRRLTSDSRDDYPHAWTPDSQSVIFESDRERYNYHLFRQRLDRHTAEKLTDLQGQQILAQVSPDGSQVLFALLALRRPSASDSLYRVGIEGGTPVEIPLAQPLDEFRCPISGNRFCVLRETINRQQYVYYALDPIHGKGPELARTAWFPSVYGDWALSPDAATIALPFHNPLPPKIRLVPLNAGKTGRREIELEVHGVDTLWGLTWAADGKGWFSEAEQAGAKLLVYIDTTGESHTLRQVAGNTWGVPSPDGRKLAFVDYTAESNVWLWQ